MPDWYDIANVYELDSPALVLYKQRVEQNIQTMIRYAGSPDVLIPHIKTAKMPAIAGLYMEYGITMFKCATIAEAEMLLMAGAPTVIIAHQLVGPKIERLIALRHAYPHAEILSLIDCASVAHQTHARFALQRLQASVLLDVNSGMNRSGHLPNDECFALYHLLTTLPHLSVQGLHVYDGHIRDTDIDRRAERIHSEFAHIHPLLKSIEQAGLPTPIVIAGGTPAFPVHCHNAGHIPNLFFSPGTAIFWDWGYGDRLTEQEYRHAAVVLGRVISKPAEHVVTLDIGHKAIASENPLDKRMRLLNWISAGIAHTLISQSEEHGVVRVEQSSDWEAIQVGDVVYALPYHVCPTVNLYDEAYIVEETLVSDLWSIPARRRRINI